jgi:hypothetical protein
MRESTVMFDIGMVVLQKCMDLLKAEPDSYSGTCIMYDDDDDDDENKAIDIKVKEDPDVKEEQDPLAMTLLSVKSEHEVSFVCVYY